MSAFSSSAHAAASSWGWHENVAEATSALLLSFSHQFICPTFAQAAKLFWAHFLIFVSVFFNWLLRWSFEDVFFGHFAPRIFSRAHARTWGCERACVFVQHINDAATQTSDSLFRLRVKSSGFFICSKVYRFIAKSLDICSEKSAAAATHTDKYGHYLLHYTV